jgi:hypothetical protein
MGATGGYQHGGIKAGTPGPRRGYDSLGAWPGGENGGVWWADDFRILHGSARMILVRRQQNLGPQTFGGSRFAGGHKSFEFGSFGFCQVNAVFLRHFP